MTARIPIHPAVRLGSLAEILADLEYLEPSIERRQGVIYLQLDAPVQGGESNEHTRDSRKSLAEAKQER